MTVDTDVNSAESRKDAIWNELLSCYMKAVDGMDEILSRNRDISFWERENGWDRTDHGKFGDLCECEKMTGEDLLSWIYDNVPFESPDWKSNRPYCYTDGEIDYLSKNRDRVMIQKWKESIKCHEKSIEKYRSLIADMERALSEG